MAALPEPWKSLRRALEKLTERVRRLENKSPFSGTGMSIPEDGVTQVDGELVVDSGVSRSGNYEPGVSGWATKGDGTAEFKDITLYDLPNSMLANPVAVGSVWEEASDFTVSTAWLTLINKSVTVPDGFTKAVVSAKSRVTAFMNQDSPDDVDYLYSEMFIVGNSSGTYPLAVTDNGGSGTHQVFRDVVLEGLTPGGIVNLQLKVSTGFETWTSPSSPGNIAKLGAAISWYR